MFDPSQMPYLHPRRDRRVALITAGNTGVGWHTVLLLYLHGYVVYLGGRSRSRCMKSIDGLQKAAAPIVARYTPEETDVRPLGELHYLELDLASLKSVRCAVGQFKNQEKALHLLINNAGVAMLPYKLTADGFELQLQTNYVAHFLLTTQLVPLMERTADYSAPPRVIYITLTAHRFVFRRISLRTSLDYRPNAVFTWFRFAMAKTAGIHFVRMLALRNPRLLCVSVQPGIVMNPNHFAYWTRLPIIGSLFWCLFHIFAFLFGVSEATGALAIFKCCVDPTMASTTHNGAHYNMLDKTQPSKRASDMDYAAQLWIWTSHQLRKRNITID